MRSYIPDSVSALLSHVVSRCMLLNDQNHRPPPFHRSPFLSGHRTHHPVQIRAVERVGVGGRLTTRPATHGIRGCQYSTRMSRIVLVHRNARRVPHRAITPPQWLQTVLKSYSGGATLISLIGEVTLSGGAMVELDLAPDPDPDASDESIVIAAAIEELGRPISRSRCKISAWD